MSKQKKTAAAKDCVGGVGDDNTSGDASSSGSGDQSFQLIKQTRRGILARDSNDGWVVITCLVGPEIGVTVCKITDENKISYKHYDHLISSPTRDVAQVSFLKQAGGVTDAVKVNVPAIPFWYAKDDDNDDGSDDIEMTAKPKNKNVCGEDATIFGKHHLHKDQEDSHCTIEYYKTNNHTWTLLQHPVLVIKPASSSSTQPKRRVLSNLSLSDSWQDLSSCNKHPWYLFWLNKLNRLYKNLCSAQQTIDSNFMNAPVSATTTTTRANDYDTLLISIFALIGTLGEENHSRKKTAFSHSAYEALYTWVSCINLTLDEMFYTRLEDLDVFYIALTLIKAKHPHTSNLKYSRQQLLDDLVRAVQDHTSLRLDGDIVKLIAMVWNMNSQLKSSALQEAIKLRLHVEEDIYRLCTVPKKVLQLKEKKKKKSDISEGNISASRLSLVSHVSKQEDNDEDDDADDDANINPPAPFFEKFVHYYFLMVQKDQMSLKQHQMRFANAIENIIYAKYVGGENKLFNAAVSQNLQNKTPLSDIDKLRFNVYKDLVS